MDNTLPQKKTSGMAVTSFILGILGLICCGLFTGLAAIICGHVSRGKIKKSNGQVQGAGLALAGLILGYCSIFSTLVIGSIFAALAVPAFTSAMDKGLQTQRLNNARQIQMVVNTMVLDGQTQKDTALGLPADADITSVTQLKNILIDKGYLSQSDADKLRFEDFQIGNVSSDDGADTVFIRTVPELSRASTVVFYLNGEGRIYRKSQQIVGSEPPRDPPYLKP